MSNWQSITQSSVALLASLCAVNFASGAGSYETFVSKYCIACHGAETQESELRIDQLGREKRGRDPLWEATEG